MPRAEEATRRVRGVALALVRWNNANNIASADDRPESVFEHVAGHRLDNDRRTEFIHIDRIDARKSIRKQRAHGIAEPRLVDDLSDAKRAVMKAHAEDIAHRPFDFFS